MTYLDEPISYWPVNTPFSPAANWPEAAPPIVIDVVDKRMVTLLLAALLFGALLVAFSPAGRGEALGAGNALAAAQSPPADSDANLQVSGQVAAQSGLSPVFTREVKYWEAKILAWAAAAGVDPDMAATVMQIESCGDPQAVSVAGAQGLFQVMPFHFAPGENTLDPDTNAARGLRYLADRLAQTQGEVGHAFAGYNGGHVAAGGGWNDWAAETQRYYVWSTGIYGEAKQGLTESATLQEWLAAGGASLCRQAAGRLGLQ